MAEQRYQAVMAVIGDGLSISQVAEKVGVSRQTLHAWLARYEAEGLEGLRIGRIGRRRVRIRCRRRWRRRCWSCVVRGRIGVRGGWCSSWPNGEVAPVPSESAVYRALVRAAMIDPAAAGSALSQVETLGARRRRWSCGRWTLSGVSRWLMAPRRKALTGIDDHSRMCVGAVDGPRTHPSGL